MNTIERNLLLTTPEFIRQREYWNARLREEAPVSTHLDLDGGCPAAPGPRAEYSMTLPAPLSNRLLELGNHSELAAYVILLAALHALLARYCHQDCTTVCAPVFQPSPEFQDVNDLVYVTCLQNSGFTFKDLLQATKQQLLEAYDHQDYPIEKLNEIFLEGEWLSTVSCRLSNIHPAPAAAHPLLSFDFSLDNGLVTGTVHGEANRFNRDHLEQLAGHFTALLEKSLSALDDPLADIQLYPYHIDGETAAYPKEQSLDTILAEQAQATPHRVAVRDRDLHITYSRLERSVNHWARLLRDKGVGPDCPVAVMMERSPELIIGILSVLKAGGGYVPIDPNYPEARRSYILNDCDAPLLLVRGGDPAWTGTCPVPTLEISALDTDRQPPAPVANPSSLAYIIYTSGTTGKPKGVMVDHQNVVQYCHWGNHQYAGNGTHSFPLFTSIAFDLTVSSLLIPLTGGHTIEIYRDSEEGLALETMARENRVDIVKLTPSHLNMMLQLPDFTAPSRIHSFILGGENLETSLCDAVAREFKQPLRIFNEYGPTEATVGCMIHAYDPNHDTGAFVSIGSAIPNAGIYLLDRHLRPVPDGVAGELYIAGAGIARGYANQPTMTDDRFVPAPQWLQQLGETGRLYHSGDLARKLPDGSLQFCGRRDHQVKIRGYRIELTEISGAVKQFPNIGDAVALVREPQSGDGRLVCYFIASEEIDTNQLQEFLSNEMPPYMVPQYLVQIDRIPLTINGKLDEAALPDPLEQDSEDIVPPRNDIEQTLTDIWAAVLKMDPQAISVHHKFFDLGGHSLSATIMSSRIHKQFGVVIPLSIVFESPTIASLAEHIGNSRGDEAHDIEPTEKMDYYNLSAAQERLFVLHELDRRNIVYNMPQAIRLKDPLSRDQLAGIFDTLIRRHDSFRTSVFMLDNQPVQRVWQEIDFTIEEIDGPVDILAAMKDFVRPFDLAQAPLLRATVIMENDRPAYLLADMHHIISDGVSMTILREEFQTLARGRRLPPLRVQYRDYAQWLRSETARAAEQRQEAFWMNYLEGEIPVLHLPYDWPRPAVQDFKGAGFGVRLSKRETANLHTLCERYGTTLFMTLSVVFALLMAKLSRQQDIIVGSPVAGRRHQDLEPIIGMFVNTLPLRSRPEIDTPIEAFFSQMKGAIVQAFDNQDYPLEKMVERLTPQRDISRNPLFDVMLILQNQEDASPAPPPQEVSEDESEEFENLGHNVSRFDMNWSAQEQNHRLTIHVEYATALFSQATVRRFLKYFRTVARQLLQPDMTIKEIDIVQPEEKREILTVFNCPDMYPVADTTLTGTFIDRCRRTPNDVALRDIQRTVTFRRLEEITDTMAFNLRKQGLGPGKLSAIMMERSIEMVAAILAILKTGAAYVPVDPKFPAARKRYILDDCATPFIVTDQDYDQLTQGSGDSASFTPPPIKSDFPAYVIYTSGSTGKPKGAVLPHHCAANTLRELQELYPVESGDSILLKTNITFDVSVAELFGWFFGDGELGILPAGDEGDPAAIIDAVERLNITHMNFVPSMFTTFLEFVPSAGIHKLRSLKYIISAGEIFFPGLVQQLKEVGLWGKVNVENLYGPTETAIYTSNFRMGHYVEGQRIPIGKPFTFTQAYVVDEGLNHCPVNVPGEILIGGHGVAAGYLNKPELTHDVFLEDPNHPGNPAYLSGDLGCWRHDGQIEFLGRIDFQVKIRGFRIELGEIQTLLLQSDNVKEAVVTAVKGSTGDNLLCAYLLAEEELDIESIRVSLEERLPEYMIPHYFIQMPEFPHTISGKVDLNQFPKPEIDDSDQFAGPENELEWELVEIWADVLKLDPEKISVNASFFSLGGHSLRATILINRLHRRLKVRIQLQTVFRNPTVRGLAQVIEDSRKEDFASIEPAAEQSHYPLSSQQERLFILQELDPGSTVYNMPQMIRLREHIELERLQHIIDTLIRRHESLRTSFQWLDNRPVQQVHQDVEFQIEQWDQDFIRPFDLAKPPLLRAAVKMEDGAPGWLLVDMHHIVSDGVSMGILRKEFQALASDEELTPLRLQYKDYAVWQRGDGSDERVRAQEAFWLENLAGDIPVLELPYDFPRPEIQDFSGSHTRFTLDNDVTEALNILARTSGATLFMTLSAAFFILLTKLSGQEDINVGVPVAGRIHADLEPIIGMFVNTLVMRQCPRQTLTVTQFLAEVKERALKMFEHQEVQFEDLVETMVVERDPGRNPLFDVMFDLHATDGDRGAPQTSTGDSGTTETLDNRFSRFDMSWTAVERANDLLVGVEYCTALFKEETIHRFIGYFKRIVAAMTASPGNRILDIDIMSPEEREDVLVRLNATDSPIDEGRTFLDLLDRAVDRHPHRIAVETQDHLLSYQELSANADRVASVLRSRGAGAGTITGLLTTRSHRMLVGILSVLKAGGAYLPIDLEYPEERVQYLMADSGAKLLLTDEDLDEILAGALEEEVDERHEPLPEDPAYVIYTSGSTGKPKGVLATHGGLLNLVAQQWRLFQTDERDRVLQFSTYCFDASVEQIFIPLCAGAAVVMIHKNQLLDPVLFNRFVRQRCVTDINTVPGFLTGIGLTYYSGLRRIVSGGDVCPPSLAFQWPTQCSFFNTYGPTETTVTAIAVEAGDLDRDCANLPIGRPIGNTRVYILDRYLKPLPKGLVGELYIGGMGVTAGYLNKPDLTAQAFVPDPFVTGERIYKTGDLARILPDNNIEFLGRADQQVKIRGFRIELEEINNLLLRHPAVNESLVTAIPLAGGDKQLCAYVVLAAGHDGTEELVSYLAGKLPDYMVPSFFVPLERFPLTANGKIDRKAFPAPKRVSASKDQEIDDPLESALRAIWAEALNLSEQSIGPDDNFFRLGGHSLKATMLAARAHKQLNVRVPLAEIFKSPTIRGLADYIKTQAPGPFTAIPAAEKKEYYPLSSAQQRLFVLQQIDPQSTAYNIPQALSLPQRLTPERLEAIFRQLLARHDSLRTSIAFMGDEPVQKIHADVPLPITYYKRGDMDLDTFVRPFDLSEAPLLRAGVIMDNGVPVSLLLDMHHIAGDGLSLDKLAAEFRAMAQGETLPLLPLQYKDFAQWQQSPVYQSRLDAQLRFWLDTLSGGITPLQLPLDRPRPEIQQFKGGRLAVDTGPERAAALVTLALQEEATMYMVLLTAFDILLSQLSGQEDIWCGTPVSGRNHADLEGIVGMFVNTLVLRQRVNGDLPFRTLLQQLKETTLLAFSNQDCQFETIVEHVLRHRDSSRNPLFDVMFEYTKVEVDLPDERPQSRQATAKFDLILHALQGNDTIRLFFSYNAALLDEATVRRLAGYFLDIVDAVLENPECRPRDIVVATSFNEETLEEPDIDFEF